MTSANDSDLLIRKQFHNRINCCLKDSENRPILLDDSTRLLGRDILALSKKFKHALSLFTDENELVAIIGSNSALIAAAILSTILNQRVPLIVSPNNAKKFFAENSAANKVKLVISTNNLDPSEFSVPTIEFDKQTLITTPIPTEPKALAKSESNSGIEQSTVLVLLTSGSSGEQKAVAISFKALDSIINSIIQYFRLDSKTNAAVSLPLSHTMALNTQFLPTFFSGGTCFFENLELKLNQVFRWTLQTRANFVCLVPDLLTLLAAEKQTKNLAVNRDVTRLILAGSFVGAHHCHLARELFPDAIIYKGYGLTEAIRVCMVSSRETAFSENGNVGFALPGQTVKILSPDGHELAANMIGEVHIAGVNTYNSYLGKSMKKRNGMLSSGDIGYLNEDQSLVLLGRADRVFKSQGRKIAPDEISNSAYKIDGIKIAVCIAIPCHRKGFRSGLVLEWAHSVNQKIRGERLQNLIRQLYCDLERYKIPKTIVSIDSMPRLPNHKVDQVGVGAKINILLEKSHFKSLTRGFRHYVIALSSNADTLLHKDSQDRPICAGISSIE